MKKCEICKKWFKNLKGYRIHCSMMHSIEHLHKPNEPKSNVSKAEIPKATDDFNPMNYNRILEIVQSEVQKALKEFNFSRPTIQIERDLPKIPKSTNPLDNYINGKININGKNIDRKGNIMFQVNQELKELFKNGIELFSLNESRMKKYDFDHLYT